MKIVTAATGKKTLRVSKKEWLAIGKKAGWDKDAGINPNVGEPTENRTDPMQDYVNKIKYEELGLAIDMVTKLLSSEEAFKSDASNIRMHRPRWRREDWQEILRLLKMKAGGASAMAISKEMLKKKAAASGDMSYTWKLLGNPNAADVYGVRSAIAGLLAFLERLNPNSQDPYHLEAYETIKQYAAEWLQGLRYSKHGGALDKDIDYLTAMLEANGIPV